MICLSIRGIFILKYCTQKVEEIPILDTANYSINHLQCETTFVLNLNVFLFNEIVKNVCVGHDVECYTRQLISSTNTDLNMLPLVLYFFSFLKPPTNS